MSMLEDAGRDEGYGADAADREKSRSGAESAWIDSRTLFGDRDEIVIRHGGQTYRLRITRYGRLILNK